MIDKLDTWIRQQERLNSVKCSCYFSNRCERICLFHYQWREMAVLQEREACAKICEDAKGYTPIDIGGGFAKLIRNRVS